MATTNSDAQPDLTLLLMTSLQAVTVSLVGYLIYTSQNNNNEANKVATKSKNIKDDDTTAETESSIKEVALPKEKRSIRGVNVYGPYKKVRQVQRIQK